MHRFFVPDAGSNGVAQLPEAEARHAVRVLRLSAGDSVTLLDGRGGEFTGRVEHAEKHGATVRILSRLQHPVPAGEVTLVQAVAKAPAMDGLLHRAVELGCRRLVPLVADRSVSRPGSPADKQGKWQAVAVEAAKQSGNPWRMQVDAPQTPAAWLARREEFELLLLASVVDEPQPLADRFAAFWEGHQRLPRSVAVIVGPEGDFTPSEYAAFRGAGALPISLGPYVLRVETAATVVLALVQSQWGPQSFRRVHSI